MNIRGINRFIFFTTLLRITSCKVQDCCQGKNIISEKKCVDGSLNDVLSCPNRFLLRSDDVDSIDEKNGILTFGNSKTYPGSFCRVKLNESDVFIVCHDPEDVEEQSTIFPILGFISSAFLFLTIAIYVSLPKLLDLQGICIVHSILGLACGFIIMGINQLSSFSSNSVCHIYAYSLYFSLLYAFFWLNAYCFHLWRTTIQPKISSSIESWQKIYYIYSCGFPVALLLLVIFSQYSNIYIYTHPRMAEERVCWFGTLEASFVYLYVPISVLLVLNVIYFFWTIYGLWKEIHKYDGKRTKIMKYRFSLCIKMFVVMGISWIFEVLSSAFEHKYPSKLWRISDTVNSLQGVLIFLVMVVFRKRVYRLLAEKPYGKFLPTTWKTIGGGEEECTETEDDYKLDQVNSS